MSCPCGRRRRSESSERRLRTLGGGLRDFVAGKLAPELLHAAEEGVGVRLQELRRPPSHFHHPAALLEGGRDVSALYGFEHAGQALRIGVDPWLSDDRSSNDRCELMPMRRTVGFSA